MNAKNVVLTIGIMSMIMAMSCGERSKGCKIAGLVREGSIEELRKSLIEVTDEDFTCEGRSLLSLSVVSVKGFESTKMLLAAGAGPGIVDGSGSGPLHEAAVWADKRVVELLVKNGFDPELKDADGATPLDLASVRSDLNGVEVSRYLSGLRNQIKKNKTHS